MKNNQNDITGLGSVKEDNNNLNNVTQQTQDTNVNFEYAKTQQDSTLFQQDADKAREVAFTEVLSGSPQITSPTLNIATTKPDLTKPEVSQSFTTRDEIMSRLNLMDENFNYTDTYTNYINQGGTPLPGYEYAHQELLNQERYDQIFKQVEDGTLSYDTALMEAYGKDIMASAFDIDVTSVAYWQNKFLNNDFSNPFTNQYLMDQVKQAAEEYHQARLAGEYAHSDFSQSTAAGLVGEEVPSDKITDIFGNLKEYADEQNLSDTELRKQITSGQIGATARIVPLDDGSGYYYIHTDGQLYLLDNKTGDNHGSFKQDQDGNITSISLNNGEILDFGRHFLASAASVFTGLAKLGSLATSGVEALFSDKSYVEALTGELAGIDSWLNDTEAINWLTDTGHIDIDGFKANDFSDWMFAVADIGGTIVGGLALGEVGGWLVKGGESLLAKGVTAWQQGSKLLGATEIAGGWTLKNVGSLAARSTGMYAGAKGEGNQYFLRGLTQTLTGKAATPSRWAPLLNHVTKTVPVYMAKDYYGSLQSMNSQLINMKVQGIDTDLTLDDISKRAFQVAAINAGISTIFAGGINDNQVQRMTLGKVSKNTQAILDKMKDKGLAITQENIVKYCGNDVLKKFLRERANTIALNTAMDLFDNFATMQIQDSLTQIDDKGSFESGASLLDAAKALGSVDDNWIKNAVQAGIMTFPTLRGQLEAEEYNVALQNIGDVHKEILKTLDDKILSTKNSQDRQTLELVKENYINDFTRSKAESTEGKIMDAVSKLTDNISDGKDVPKIIKDSFRKVVSKEKTAFFKNMAEVTRTRLETHKAAVYDTYQNMLSKTEAAGIKGLVRKAAFGIPSAINAKFGSGIDKEAILSTTNKKGLNNLFGKRDAQGNLISYGVSDQFAFTVNKEFSDAQEKFIKAYQHVTGTKTSDDFIDQYGALKYTTIDDAVSITNVKSLKKDGPLETKIKNALGNQADNYTIFRIKNEATLDGDSKFNARMKGNLMKTTFEILTEGGTDNSFIVKIDDNHYAMYDYKDGIAQTMTLDTVFKINASIAAIKDNEPTKGAKLLVSTMLGDYGYNKLKNEKSAEAGNIIVNALDKAYKNGFLTISEATATLNSLLNPDKEVDKVLSNAMSVIKKEVDLKLNNIDNFNSLTDVEANYKIYKALEEADSIANNKSKVYKSDKQKAALALLLNDGQINPRVEKIIEDYQGGKYKEVIQKLRESLNSPKVSDGIFKSFVASLSDMDMTNKDEVSKQAKSYFRSKGLKYKEFKKDIDTLVDHIVKIASYSEQKKFDGNIVVVNYAHSFGEESKKMQDAYQSQAMNRKDTELERMGLYTQQVSKEVRTQTNLMVDENGKFNKAVEVFDLNDQFSRQKFVKVATDLDFFIDGISLETIDDIEKALRSGLKDHAVDGISNVQGAQDIVKYENADEIAPKLMAKLKEIQPEMFEVDIRTGEAKKIDMLNQFRSEVKLNNLSKEQAARYKMSGEDVTILPYAEQEEYILNNITQVLNQTDEDRAKSGTIAGKGTSQKITQAVESFGAAVNSDPDLSKHFAMKQIIDTITKDPNAYTFRISTRPDIETELTKAGLLEFYEISETTSDYIVLRQKANANELMTNYLNDTSIDFNLFKILPVLSNKKPIDQSQYYRHPLIQDGQLEFNGEKTYIPDLYFGNQGINKLDDIFNISFAWDPQNKLKTELLYNLFSKAMNSKDLSDFSYNPFTVKPGEEALTKLCNTYTKMFNDIVTKTTNGKTEDWRAWAQEDNVLKKLNKLYQEGTLDTIDSKELAKQILEEFRGYYVKNTYASPSKASYASTYRTNNSYVDTLMASPDIIKRAAGLVFDPIDPVTKDYYPEALKDLTNAIDQFKNTIPLYTDYQTYIDSDFSKYQTIVPNSETRFAQAVGGSNGYFMINDLDWVDEMEFDMFRKIVDKSVIEKEADAKKLYTTLKQTSKAVNDRYEYSLMTIANKNVSEIKGAIDPNAPSISLDDITGMVVSKDDVSPDEIQTLRDIHRVKSNTDNNRGRIQRLSDAAYNQDSIFSKRFVDAMGNVADRNARDAFSHPANMEILNIQDTIGYRAALEIENNTTDSLKQFATEIDSKVSDDQILNLSRALIDSVAGATQYVSEYNGYQLINKDTFEVIATAPKTKTPYEVLNMLEGIEDLKGTILLDIDKHDLKSNDAIKFNYKVIDSDNDILDLKGKYLSDAVDAMYYGFKDEYPDKTDYITFLSKLSNEDFNALLNQKARTHLSKQTILNIISKSISEIVTGYNEQGIRDILMPQVYGNPNFNIEGLNNLIKNTLSALDSDSIATTRQANLAVFGVDESMLSEVQKNILEQIENKTKISNLENKEFNDLMDKMLNSKFKSHDHNEAIGQMRDAGIDALDVAKQFISLSRSGEALSYKTISSQKISEMGNPNYESLSVRTWIDDSTEGKIKVSEINPKDTVVLDIEGSNNKYLTGTDLEDMFQIALNTEDDSGLRHTTTYFILHKDPLTGNIILPKDWTAKHIDKDLTDKSGKKTFYGKEEAYRDAVSKYESYIEGNNKYNFITTDQLKSILDSYSNIIAYNGRGYDFKILSKLGLSNPKFIDAFEFHSTGYAGDNPFAKLTQTKMIGANKQSFADVENNNDSTLKLRAHDAGDDTQALASWVMGTKDQPGVLKTISDNTYKAKARLKTVVDNIADVYGIKDKESFYKQIDKAFAKDDSDYTLNNLRTKNFNQEMIDSSDTSQILRYLNFLQKDDLGTLLFNYNNDQVYKDLGVKQEVRNLIQNKGWNEVQKTIAFLMSKDDSLRAQDAFNQMISTAFDAQEGNKTGIKVLEQITNPEFINNFGSIDESDPLYIRHLNALRDNMSKGISGNSDYKYGLNGDIQAYEKYGGAKAFLTGLHDISRKLNVNEKILDYALQRSLSPTTSTDPNAYNIQKELSITNKEAQKFADLTADISKLDTLVATKVDGIYKMIQPLNTFGEQLREITLNKNGSLSKKNVNIKDIGADTIVLSKKAAMLICNNNLNELFDEDGQAWCYSLAYPSDKQSHLLAHKLRIVDGEDARIYATPTVMKVLRARDFDGDFITVFNAGTKEQKAIARASSKYLYKAHDIQEGLLQFTTSFKGNGNDDHAFTFAMSIANNNKIIDICNELDIALSKNADTTNIENRLLEQIKVLATYSDYSASDAESIAKYLGVNNSKGEQFKYVANPMIYNKDSYSRNQRLSWILSSSVNSSNVADSVYGYFKKWKMSSPVDDYEITNPLSQLNSTSIYLTDELLTGIHKIETTKQASQYLDQLQYQISKVTDDLNNETFSSNMRSLQDTIVKVKDSIETESDIAVSQQLLEVLTNNVLYDVEYNIRKNSEFNNEVLDIMKDSIENKSQFRQDLEHQMKLKELRDSIKGNKDIHIYGGATHDIDNETLMMASKWSQLIKDQSLQVVNDISEYNKSGRATVGVLLDDLGTGEDAIFVNKDTNLRQMKLKDIKAKEYIVNKLGVQLLISEIRDINKELQDSWVDKPVVENPTYNTEKINALEKELKQLNKEIEDNWVPREQLDEEHYNINQPKIDRQHEILVELEKERIPLELREFVESTKTLKGKHKDLIERRNKLYDQIKDYKNGTFDLKTLIGKIIKLSADDLNYIFKTNAYKHDAILSDITFNKDNEINAIQIAELIPLEEQKLAGLGKGKIKSTSMRSDTTSFDYLINEGVFKDRKLGATPYFNSESYKIETVYVKETNYKGKVVEVPKRVMVFTDVPTYVVMDDTAFDNDSSKKIEAMSFYGSRDNLPGFGFFNDAAYETRDDKLFRTDKATANLFEDRDNGHKISYSNAVQQIQLLRTDLLAQAITDMNLWQYSDKLNFIDKDINSYEDMIYCAQHNKLIASKEYQYMLQNLKNFIIKTKGQEAWNNWLDTRSDAERSLFSPNLEKYFANYKQAARYKFLKNGEVELLTSKTSRKVRQEASSTVGLVDDTNAGQRITLPSHTRDLEDYYIPFNVFYETLSGGYLLNNDDILEATRQGILSHRTTLKGEANTEGNFKPVDSIYSMEIDNDTSDMLYMNDYKNGHGGVPDDKIFTTLNGMKYYRPKDETNIIDLEKLPKDTSYYNALMNSQDLEIVNAPSKTKDMLAYLLYNAADYRNDNNVARAIATSTKNVDDQVKLTVLKNMFSIDDGDITYKAKDFTNKGKFADIENSEDLNLRLNKYNYYTHKEIYDKYKQNTSQLTENIVDTLKYKEYHKDDAKNNYDNDTAELFNIAKDAYEGTFSSIKSSDNIPSDVFKEINFTFNFKPTKEVFENSLIEGSGIKIKGEDTANVAVAMKNYASLAEYTKVEANRNLSSLASAVTHINKQDFIDYCKYNWLEASKNISDSDFNNKLEYLGIKESDFDSLKLKAATFERSNSNVAKLYSNTISSITDLVHRAEKVTNEPFGNLSILLAPFKSTDTKVAYGQVKNAINNAFNFDKYDPTAIDKGLRSNMVFNFFDSSKMIIDDLSKIIGIEEMSTTLSRQGLLDNKEVFDKAYQFITDNIDVTKLYISKKDTELFNQVNEDILGILDYYTDIDVNKVTKGVKNGIEKFQRLYSVLDNQTEEMRMSLMNSDASTGEWLSLSTVQQLRDSTTDFSLKESYSRLYDNMWAKTIIAQRLIEVSPSIMNNMTDYLNKLNQSGYTLCNKFGQKISMDSYIKPLSNSSLRFLSENVELAYNNSNPEKFAQWVLEKSLSGDIYIAKKDLVDQLEQKIYTRKIPGKVLSTLKDISSKSAAIQMAMPAKMLSRLARFTGFDYVMGAIYNPNSIKYINQAQKEIMAAVHTKGASLQDNPTLVEYFKREGQPLGQTGKDPINFTEDINGSIGAITDKLTSPLEIQNHLGRYAIYLSALESFKNNDGWYGPAYVHKDAIDKLATNEDKAMFVMDYMLGSPGGFPYLSKKTSGLMMYSTFPMNLTRTMGAWGMSVAKLAQEGFTSENSKQWMKTVAWPSIGVAGVTVMSNLLISYLCELFGIDEKTEEDWKKNGVSIDPLATLVGGTPSVTYDSINPIKNLEEMFIGPFTNTYNDTTGKKIYGFVQNNVLGKLNPAIKVPIELITKKDMYGSSAIDVSNQYTNTENAIRKTLGFFIGTGMANNIVDQTKIDKYNEDSTFANSLVKGFTRGLSSDFGNQKSWKKGVSNYYSAIDSVRTYAYLNNDYANYDADTDDLRDVSYLNKQRTYTKSYGEVNQDDYQRINNLLKKMIKKNESPSTVYALIADEYNNGVSEATLRKVLNNNSILRKLNNIDKAAYYNTLSSRDLEILQSAIRFEKELYPLLQEFFPTGSSSYFKKNYYKPYYKKPYSKSGYTSYPRTYKPTYVNYYPNNGYNNKKVQYNKNKSSIDKVKVDVSPQMAVWDRDYNAIKDLPRKTWYGGGKK